MSAPIIPSEPPDRRFPPVVKPRTMTECSVHTLPFSRRPVATFAFPNRALDSGSFSMVKEVTSSACKGDPAEQVLKHTGSYWVTVIH